MMCPALARISKQERPRIKEASGMKYGIQVIAGSHCRYKKCLRTSEGCFKCHFQSGGGQLRGYLPQLNAPAMYHLSAFYAR
jgi:hypothetical protein